MLKTLGVWSISLIMLLICLSQVSDIASLIFGGMNSLEVSVRPVVVLVISLSCAILSGAWSILTFRRSSMATKAAIGFILVFSLFAAAFFLTPGVFFKPGQVDAFQVEPIGFAAWFVAFGLLAVITRKVVGP
ncbi:MAG: hypothetical protein ABJP79_18190 [Tateyamaria sp.]|uniref:hypothetical protein n=1 Tax=Tateyamaria sp. TaxID=1929288 RepID=UPI00329B95DE